MKGKLKTLVDFEVLKYFLSNREFVLLMSSVRFLVEFLYSRTLWEYVIIYF